jgi:tetratricopeptide (TPR) repeat protein
LLHLNDLDNNWKLWRNLGDKSYICDNFYRALFCYNRALNINPENAELLCKKGYALSKLYKTYKSEKAEEYFKKLELLDKSFKYGGKQLCLK